MRAENKAGGQASEQPSEQLGQQPSQQPGQSGSQRSGSVTEAARRKQIVGGAVTVLARGGYNAASLAAIAEHLGISKGVISYHFAGKAELLQEVVRVVLAEAGAWMASRVAAAPTFTDALRRYIASNLGFLKAHRDETIALTEVLANARATPGVPELFQASQSDAVAALESLFTGGQHAGEFGTFSARTAAIALRASIDSVTGLLRDDPDFDLNGYGTELAALFERLSARPLPEPVEGQHAHPVPEPVEGQGAHPLPEPVEGQHHDHQQDHQHNDHLGENR